MPHGGQGDNLSFKEGGMDKRSMPPSFHANLFALAAARYRCHDIGGPHCTKSAGAGLTVAHGVVV